MTRNEAAYTGEVGSMQFSHFLQIYGKLYSLKYDGACRSKGPVHGYEAIRLKQIYKNRFIERREHAKHPSGGRLNSAIVLRLAGSKYPEYPTTPASSRHARPDSLRAQEKRRPNNTRSASLHSPKMRTVSRNTLSTNHIATATCPDAPRIRKGHGKNFPHPIFDDSPPGLPQ